MLKRMRAGDGMTRRRGRLLPAAAVALMVAAPRVLAGVVCGFPAPPPAPAVGAPPPPTGVGSPPPIFVTGSGPVLTPILISAEQSATRAETAAANAEAAANNAQAAAEHANKAAEAATKAANRAKSAVDSMEVKFRESVIK
jgi:hypothetical protein